MSSGSGRVQLGSAVITSCQQPYAASTATRWPASNPLPGGAERTTPAASMPGANGRVGLTW